MTSLGAWHTLTSPNIHVYEIIMLNIIYYYDEIRGKINSLYLLRTILLLCFYLVSITKQKPNIFFELDLS
jgi:hypothetical protein